MILLELNENKQLIVKKMHSIFVGENNFDSINIQLVTDEISGHNVSDCTFTAHVVFPDQSYLEYELDWDEAASAEISISKDLTSAEQKLKIFVEITAENNVLGQSNTVEIKVEHIINEALRIVSRDELVEIISNILETKLDAAPGAVKTANINDAAVTTDKLADNSVTDDKIYNGSVKTNKINDGAVTNDKLASSSVARQNVFDRAINSNKLDYDAVITENINDGAVTSAKIADGAVTYDKIATGAVHTSNIYQAAIIPEKIANGSILTDKILDGAVTPAKLANTYLKYIDNEGIEPMTLTELNAISATYGEIHWIYADGSIFGSSSTVFGYLLQGASMQIVLSLRDGAIYSRLHGDLGWTTFSEKYAKASDVTSLASRVTTLENANT